MQRLDWRPKGTQWADYAHDNNYTEAAHEAKRQLVRDFVAASRPRTVWDMGGNTGMFSRVARAVAPSVVCFDIDPAAVELNYRQVRSTGETGNSPPAARHDEPVAVARLGQRGAAVARSARAG